MRYLYHLCPRGTELPARYAPEAFAREGFVHASFADAAAESARRYFPEGAPLDLWRVDPRRLDVPVELAATPRGPMPHVLGTLPADAVVAREPFDGATPALDRVTGHHILVVGFRGVTLLDLVGVWDPLSRIASMGFDPGARCDIASLDEGVFFDAAGVRLEARSVRPPLDDVDLLVLAGGPGTRALERVPEVLSWLRSRPSNRAVASVCTGALLLGAAGLLEGRRATTHKSQLARLADYGAIPTSERVVRDGPAVTAGGVTSGIDLGLFLVRWLTDDATADAVGAQMEAR